MKTYKETIDNLATQSFNLAMDGCQSDTPQGIGIVAFIYGKDISEVSNDVRVRTKQVSEEYFAARKAS